MTFQLLITDWNISYFKHQSRMCLPVCLPMCVFVSVSLSVSVSVPFTIVPSYQIWVISKFGCVCVCVLGVQIEGDESDDDGNLVFFCGSLR